MASLVLRAVGLLCASVSAYETWHMVDVAQVVCPKPVSSNPNAPAYPDYNLGINYTSAMIVDAPHIVSFMRTSKKAMKITFKIEDYYGDEVVPETTVDLQELGGAVPDNCQCTTTTIPAEVAATYGTGYGTQCFAWDDANCGGVWGNLSVGAWCCKPWCYASKDCPDAYSSSAIPGAFFSYSACSSLPESATCRWTAVAEANDPCVCKSSYSIFNTEMQAKFHSSYGEKCGTWDFSSCAVNYRPDQLDTWCCKSWCYVDKKCPSAIQSLNAGMEDTLFWSDNACDDDSGLVVQCPYKPQPNVTADDTDCMCLGQDLPAGTVLPAGVHADYGVECGPHDAQICELTYPHAAHDMWCCQSWCWVKETCPTARASAVVQGMFWSTSNCTMDEDVISSCKYSDACECAGTPGILPSSFGASYGSSCDAWDSTSCKGVWYHNSDSGWNTSSDHEWCCDSWCYVNETCPIAKLSWLGTGYYFSYQTCDDPEETYVEATDTCDSSTTTSTALTDGEPTHRRRTTTTAPGPTHRRRGERRLRATGDEEESNELDEEIGSAPLRKLAGRRRSSYSSYSSYSRSRSSSYYSSSSRRRAPAATSVPARRRSYSAPTSTTRRRRSPAPSPPPDVRRRAPPPPAPAPVNSRRRTTSMDGKTYTTTPRRRSSSTSASTLRRRRTDPPQPYGYNSRPQMANNYGGVMPQQTSYGYSGYNAYPAQKKTNVAMYAAGGLVAGVVVGAGAMYAYNSMYGDAYDTHRRRRHGEFGQADWCIVNDVSSTRQGAMMECADCYRLYGPPVCPSAAACQTAAGCSYTTPSAFNRDDLAETGFIPKDFAPPLRVLITKIESADIDPDPVSGICPPTTTAEASLVESFNKTMSFKPDLFLVLTKQEVLRTEVAGCDKDTMTACTTDLPCWHDNSMCSSGGCMCITGYCWSGTRCMPGEGTAGARRSMTVDLLCPLLLLLVVGLRFRLRG